MINQFLYGSVLSLMCLGLILVVSPKGTPIAKIGECYDVKSTINLDESNSHYNMKKEAVFIEKIVEIDVKSGWYNSVFMYKMSRDEPYQTLPSAVKFSDIQRFKQIDCPPNKLVKTSPLNERFKEYENIQLESRINYLEQMYSHEESSPQNTPDKKL